MSRLAILTAEFLPFHGGVGTYARELAHAAKGLGHEVTVFAPDYGEALANTDRDHFAYQVERFRAGLRGPCWYPSYTITALKVMHNPVFEQVLAADIPFLEVLASTWPLHRRTYKATIYGSEVNKARLSLRGKLFRPARIFEHPAHIFAISNYTRDLLLSRFPKVLRERTSVTHLGLDKAWFARPTEGPAELCSRLGVEKGRMIVVCVARITRRKGQQTLLAAVAALPEAVRAKLAVVLVGSDSGKEEEYAAAVRSTAATTAPAQVLIPGILSDEEVRALYNTADVFCLPGARDRIAVEGFGLVFLEAASQGLAAVAGALGGVPEVVRDGETGLLVPPDDPAALGKSLLLMLENRDLRARLGEAARLAARTFTWERCAQLTFGAS